jgi:iron complex transport system substrate-binding protein
LIIVGKEKELTLVDSVDRIVTVKKPVKRVLIAYWVDAAITLQALKAEDTVVGVTKVIKDDPILFPELSELPCVGTDPRPDALDYEKILELEPDMVFAGGTSMTPASYEEVIERIHSLDPDITVLVFTFCAPSVYYEEVKKTGYIFNRKEEAEELIDWIEGHLSTIDEKVSDIPDDERTKVYTEFFMDYYTGGEGTAYQEYIEMAGGKNVFSDITSYGEYYLVEVSPEEIIVRNPEVILHHPGMVYVSGYQVDDVTALREKREEIMDRPGFSAIEAVESGRVYTLDSNIVLNAMYPVGVSYYAKWFYPEEFAELDPNEIHQEYLTRFLRIDYDLDNHGVFVYHPEQHPDGR